MEYLKVSLTALLSVGALFFMAKIIGHKQMSQLDFFDYISGITVGSIAAELATELEEPIKPLIALVVYGAIAVLLSKITSVFPKTRKYINGAPTILMDRGKLYRENMKKAKLDLSEFMVLCRQQGYFNLNDIQTAVFEFNGKLSILPISTKRPANPEDLNLSPEPESIQTELIMDGRILDGNLKRMGLEGKWLQKQLTAQGYGDAKEILLALCDDNHQLTLFPMEA